MKNRSTQQPSPASKSATFASLPSVDQLLGDARVTSLIDEFGKDSVKQILVCEIDHLRNSIASARNTQESVNAISQSLPTPQALSASQDALSRSEVADHIICRSEITLAKKFTPSIRPVINLTGVILHTNLGRAPYPQSAIDAMIQVSTGAANVEYDLSNGKRGKRDDHIAHWICELTGAEAATAVNNNAAAVLLVLNTLAEKRQVIVSRGELIEIGGSFRMPDIMKKARCKLVEVGTTNRTHSYDYLNAINKKTAALMKVHTSNFEVAGFGHSVSVADLAAIANNAGIPVIDDMGSGNLLDLASYGLPPERTAKQAIDEGADIITFSGDKLLGGPQCGLIAGNKDLIEQINKNPFKRAMRLDKVTLAALEAVLKLYCKPATLEQSLPTLALLTRSQDEIEQTAVTLAGYLRSAFPEDIDISVRPCESQIGSGSLPTKTIDSHAVVISCSNSTTTIESLASQARKLPLPVIGRVYKKGMWLDCRALTDHKDIRESVNHWRDLLIR